MGTYSTVDASFWTDPVIVDNFTPEDKYFYLYLLTCPFGNIAGCFEISLKQLSDHTGYSRDSIERLIERFVTFHKVIDYCKETKEILICNWGKHHWTTSDKYLKALRKRIDTIKTPRFREYLYEASQLYFNSEDDDTVWIPYTYGMDTSSSVTYPYTIYPSVKGKIEEGDKGGMGEEGGEERKQKPEKEVVITIPLNDGSEYPVEKTYYEQMQELYPAVDVMQELMKMKAWSINNAQKRKTKGGIKRFIGSWLAKEQDRGGTRGTIGRGESRNGSGENRRSRYNIGSGGDPETDPKWQDIHYDIS